MKYIISYLITFLACGLGTICGMGGGIIIKPVLDAAGIMSVASITFLSGCTVICMTCWTLGKTIIRKESVIDLKNTILLAVAAAIGGIIGKMLFNKVASLFANPDTAGGVQASLLLAATFATFIYTINKSKIKSKETKSPLVVLFLGFLLGILGSFLGIGGGPFNAALLIYFFSMKTKKATQNSLVIVLFSQVASTLQTLTTKGIPEIPVAFFIGMIICGILGSELGRSINKKIDDTVATKYLLASMIIVMGINVYNIIKFFGI